MSRHLLFTTAAVAALLVSPMAHASFTYQVLYSFCNQSNCTDGNEPLGLTMDSSGNIYGITEAGGANNHGSVFELTNNGGSYSFSTLYSFCPQAGCADGAKPEGGLLVAGGTIYGTTVGGGANNSGVLFSLSSGSETVLHSFCSGLNCADGANPNQTLSILPSLAGINLTGVAPGGGAHGKGVIFTYQNGQYSVAYSFCSNTGNCPSGYAPSSGLTASSGVTQSGGGGGYGHGTLYQLQPTGATTDLYDFCQLTNCADGSNATGMLIHTGVNYFGNTATGGAYGNGVLFRLVTSQTGNSYWDMYDFCSEPGCVDGSTPVGGIAMDPVGYLFGATQYGGSAASPGAGVVWGAFGPAPAPIGYQVMHAFCSQQNCTDGENPLAGVIVDSSCHVYGTTSAGGANGGGVVYRVTYC